jgi:tetratricopeptide (TPR) repeat protein
MKFVVILIDILPLLQIMKNLIITLLGCVIFFNCQAQGNEIMQILKKANTRRELQNYEEADKLLAKVLSDSKDDYERAVAYEYRGLMYKDLKDYAKAAKDYAEARRLYMALGDSQNSLMINELSDNLPIFAGIDIGSKGVKLSIVEAYYDKKRDVVTYKIRLDSSINTTIINLKEDEQALPNTARAAKNLFNFAINQNGIPLEKVKVVVSSGVLGVIDNLGKRSLVLQTLRDSLHFDKVATIDACEEARLLTVGVIPEMYHLNSTTLDIGSGNTKGGYYTQIDGLEFKCLSFPYGTESLLKKVIGGDTPAQKAQKMDSLWNFSLKNEVSTVFNSRIEMRQRRDNFLVGGIVWAVVMCMHPERSQDLMVEITLNDVNLFKQMAISNYEKLKKPDLSPTLDKELKAKIEKDLNRLNKKVFSQENLIVGSTWLEGLLKVYNNGGVSDKKFYFLKEGYVGWITGYIIKDIATKKDKYFR